MTDKQIKEEIKQVVTNLGNIEFTVEDELEFCKEVLKRKEQECEELKKTLDDLLKVQYKLVDNCKELRQIFAEIKELLLKTPTSSQEHCVNAKSVILQKISECEVENEHNGLL